MAVDLNGILHLVLIGLTENIFGNMTLTATVLSLFFVMLSLLIQIPVPFALAIPLPFIIVLTAYGYLTVAGGGILSVIFLTIAVASFLSGVGINR